MRKIILLTIALSALIFAFDFSADTVVSQNLKKTISSVPPHEDFPNASYYIICDSSITKLTQSGSETERYFLAKAYTYRGKKKLSNFKIIFNADYDAVELIRARTINADGVSTVDSTEVNEVIAPGYSAATIYTKMMQMVISVPAFAESSVIEIHYKTRTSKDAPIPFGGMNVLVGEEPAKKVFFALSGKKINYKSISGAPKPKIAGNTASWTIKDYKGAQFESNMLPLREIMPTVLYSASRNWVDELESIAGMFLPHTVGDDDITALAESLSTGKSKRDALESILYYIQEKFNRIHISPNRVGYRPNDAGIVLKNGYGDSRDLSVLLISMLQAIKIQAKPALVASGGAKIQDFPSVHQFSRMVVMVELDGKILYLDPMQEYASAGFLGSANGEKSLIISPGETKLNEIPAIRPDDNMAIHTYDLSLDASGNIAGEITTTVIGDAAGSIRSMFRHAKKSKKKQKFQKAASNVADGAKIEGEPKMDGIETNSGKATIEFSFTANNFLITQDPMAILWLPNSAFGLFSLPDISEEKRTFPIYLEIPIKIVKDITIKIPDEYSIVYVPPVTHIEDEVGTIDITSQHGNNSMQISISLSLKEKRISTDEYEKLRNLVRTIFAKKFKIILLEKQI
ncbi:hypothetical protein DRQ29_04305 [bacterium]|nr:MAG: hypothetical protein DRQ29_04305 [bacterium]